MTDGPEVWAYVYTNNPIAATVRVSANKGSKKKNKVGIRRRTEVQAPTIYGKWAQDVAQMTANRTSVEIFKKPWTEPCQNILLFPETGKIQLFKIKNYKIPATIKQNSSRLCPIIRVLDTDKGPNPA